MGSNASEPVTELLLHSGAGDRDCLNELISVMEQELRRIAHRHLRRERAGHTLQTTALVNEAWLKLVDQSRANWRNRVQFPGVAAVLMRHILADHARAVFRGKRGGGAAHPPLDEGLVFSPSKSAALLAPDDALSELAPIGPRRRRWWRCALRYFGGTVIRDRSLARAWLKHELSPKDGNAG